jgi:hypothetical protein
MATHHTVLQPDILEEQVMTVQATQTRYDLITPKHKIFIPFLPTIAASSLNIATWICEYCDSEWSEDFKRCGECKKWKGGKEMHSRKKKNRTPLLQRRNVL